MRAPHVSLAIAGFLLATLCLVSGCSGAGTEGSGFTGIGSTGGGGGSTGGGTDGTGSTGGTGASGSSSYAYSFSFGSKGTGDGQLENPRGIAQDSSGNIYVTDGAVQTGGYGNNRIEEYTAKGTFVQSISGTGTNSGEFAAPTSVTIDTSGNLYGVFYPGIVLQFTSAGAVNGQIGSQGSGAGQYTNPYTVYYGKGGLLYVADYGANQVDEYTTTGTFETALTAGGGLLQPWGAATDSSGDVFVTDNGHGRVVKMSSSGSVLKTFTPSTTQYVSLAGIAVDSSGDVYVADAANNVVDKFDNNGNFITSFGAAGSGNGQLQGPSGVLVDSKGNVYVVDTGNDRVEVFSPG